MLFEKENNLREAFERIKNDIFSLGSELSLIRREIFDFKQQINGLNQAVYLLQKEVSELRNVQKTMPYHPTPNPTDNSKKSTSLVIPTHNPTGPMEIGGLKCPNLSTSIGNAGVPTDRQTDQQTDNYHRKTLNQSLFDATKVLASLDSLKKEIRLKFKQITKQEMLVFSTIYQLESELSEGVDYKQIAQKLHLSESSIRDYVKKIVEKGISIDKIKLNNKKILLKIPQDLKNIAPLQTLIQLREL